MSGNESNRGSEWRKWDLHVHTPSSYDWDSKCKKTNKDIVEIALEKGISAIAVTDHHTTKSIDEIKELGEEHGLFVIPGVELSTDKGNQKIHIIALFEPSTSGKKIYDDVLCPLGFSEAKIKEKTNEQVYCDFEDACDKIHELGGLVFLHAGSKANGIEQLSSDLKSLLKKDIASKVDIFEVTSEKSAKEYHSIVFPIIKREIPCLITSDSLDRTKLKYIGGHSTDGIGKAFSWIKADLSFSGLKQIVCEPKDRIFLGTTPQKLLDLKANPTNYIDSLDISVVGSVSPAWFQDRLSLSYGLTAIIGKKGSGKSALVDILALSGKSAMPSNSYSFLKANKFRKNLAVAKKYESEITWLSGDKIKTNLANEVDAAVEYERVRYLPQSHVERICNDDDGVSNLFQEEINKVIFSYVPLEKRLGRNSLDELIKVKTEEINTKVESLREDLDGINKNIETLEAKDSKEYKLKIENLLKQKKKELGSIKDPAKVQEPAKKLSQDQQKKLQKTVQAIEDVEKEIEKERISQAKANNAISFLSRFQARVKNLQEEKDKITTLFSEEAKAINFDVSEIITIEINTEKINTEVEKYTKEVSLLDAKLDVKGRDPKVSLYANKQQLEEVRTNIVKTLDDSQKEYQKYLDEKKLVDEARKAIVGKKGDITLNTITSLEEEISYLDLKLKNDLQKEYNNRISHIKLLYKAIIERIEVFKEIYEPLISFIEDKKEKQKQSGNILNFDAGIVFEKIAFAEKFLSHISQARDGSFQLKDKGEKVLKEILAKYSLESSKEVVEMFEEIMHNLQFDTTKDPKEANDISKQLNSKYQPHNLYNFLSQLNYVDVRFKILFNGKDLNDNEFSPGEKGALLLIFYLLIDNSRVPLIMDQPEENLDNESVYSLLVPYIQEAREKRQVIIVTHNPNLAVVCDAEQIICASMNKKNNEIRYESGSIEDPHTNKRIVDILEGTMPAFKKRDAKYLKP